MCSIATFFTRPSPSSPPSLLFLLKLVLSISLLLSCANAGTWLSFNQNTGGMELADRFLGAPFHGKSIADVVASGELNPEDNAQFVGLLRMCKDRVKRTPGQRNEQMDDLCSALLQLSSNGQRQRRKRGGARASRFVPIQSGEMDEELLWL